MDERIFTQILLGLILVFSAAIFLAALNVIGPAEVEAWAVLVAVLAVLSSVISAWSSFRVVDLQKEALKPSIRINYDFKSRYNLVLLELKNTGGSAAKKIKVNWDKKIKNHKDEEIIFRDSEQSETISYLSQDESISRIIDAGHNFFERNEETKISGTITFENLNGQKMSNIFHISAEHYRGSPLHSREELKTNYEIQKIPKSIDKLAKEVKELKNKVEQNNENLA
jgi:hypothetical protein